MNRHLTMKYTIAVILLIVAAFASLSVGTVFLTPSHILSHIFTLDDFILTEYRLPRMLLGFIVGVSLAVSGALIQGVVKNELASPDVIGITKGASLTAVIVIMLFPSAPLFLLPFSSFIGALIISIFLTILISKFNVKGSRLALIGLAIGAICTAIVQFLLIRNPMDANTALVWLTGSLYGHDLADVGIVLPWFIIVLPFIIYFSRKLDILALGDDVATGLGAKVQGIKMLLLFLAVVLAGSSIAVVGGLSFLGLISPHIARSIVGHKYIHVICMSGLVGAIILLILSLIHI